MEGLKSFINKFLLGTKARAGIITILDQSVVSATNFFTGVIIGRTLSKEQFGFYMLGLTIVFIVINLQNSLISWPYAVYYRAYRNTEDNIYKGSTLIHVLFLCGIVFVFVAFLAYLSSIGFGPNGVAPILLALALTIAFIMLREFVRRLFFASMDMHFALALDFMVAAFQISGLIILAQKSILSASRSYWVIGGACGLVSITWLLWNRKEFAFSAIKAWLDFRQNFSFGKWIFAGITIFTSCTQLFPWLLANYHGAAATGTLAAYLGILGLANPFQRALSNFLLPMGVDVYSRGGVRELREVVAKAVVVIGIIMGLFCVFISILGNQAVIFIYGEKYASSGPALFLLSLSVFVAAVSYPFGSVLYILDRPEQSFKCDLIGSAIIITFGVFVVKAFGLLGVGIGLFASNLGASVVRYFFCKESFRVKEARDLEIESTTIYSDTLKNGIRD
jgi:O-antigen/teichoic acid export membrane protein